MTKVELSKVCENEFETFKSGISKMGFDLTGFKFAVYITNKSVMLETLESFNNLTDEERQAVKNRIELLK